MSTTPPRSLSGPSFGNTSRKALTDDSTVVEPHQPYWERLPLEILTDIFLLCRPLKEDLPPSNTHAPYLLTYVCRAWFKLVTNIPKMWSTVVLTIPSAYDHFPPSRVEAGIRHLKMCIIRSKATPLRLYIRAEFMARPVSLKCIQCAEVQRLTLVYPFTPSGPLQSFFPRPLRMVMPNLTTLEVHSRRAIASSDLEILNGIMDSAHTLKKHVFHRPAAERIHGPPIMHNMSSLEVLTIQEPIPISFFPLVLRRAPVLRNLSLAVGNPSPNQSDLELLQTLTTEAEEITQPLVHSNLQYLALTHFQCDLSTPFESVALPLLQALVVSFHAGDSTMQPLWPHDVFIAFLRRSGCKLKSFHVLNQLITSSQLLELLRLPCLTDSLEYLGIQQYTEEGRGIDDYVLEELTLSPFTPQEEAPLISTPDSKTTQTGGEPPTILCPNLERFFLFVPLDIFTLSKLVAMLNSRLPRNGDSMPPHKPLRHAEMYLYDGLEIDLVSLRDNGLVLTLFGPSESNPMPLDAKQQRLWGYHLSEGLDDEVYDHAMGTWRTSDITLAIP